MSELAKPVVSAATEPVSMKDKDEVHPFDSNSPGDILIGPNGEEYPTAEDLTTLRRTYGHVPVLIYSIAFIELCERFSYYGTIIVCESLNYRYSLINISHHLTPTQQSTTISTGHCLRARQRAPPALMAKPVL